MTKVERINAAYEYLVYRKVIGGQEDVASAMSSTQPNVSQALKGVPRVLTDRFIRRFCAAYPIISVDWVLSEKGEMLAEPNNREEHSPSPEQSIIDLAASLIKENETLRKQLTSAIQEIHALHNELSSDREALRAVLASLTSITYTAGIQHHHTLIAAESTPSTPPNLSP